MVQIYKACNFQDLADQRIGDVIGTLDAIEEQVAAMLDHGSSAGGAAASPAKAKSASGRGLLNGPKLDGDPGHASQRNIGEMFGERMIPKSANRFFGQDQRSAKLRLRVLT
jgi:chemotaxis protein CheZ